MNVIEIRVEYGRKIDQIQKTNSQKNCNKKKKQVEGERGPIRNSIIPDQVV